MKSFFPRGYRRRGYEVLIEMIKEPILDESETVLRVRATDEVTIEFWFTQRVKEKLIEFINGDVDRIEIPGAKEVKYEDSCSYCG